ncbi:MAG: alpha/beta hydrolase family protein [Gallionella sp.]|nr:alpha/beta hydrolase family protein [Gallionella sp.]
MHKNLTKFVLVIACLTGSLAVAGPPSGSAYLDGGTSKVGVILCHGRGHHPKWNVVDPLRKGINEKLGYHTLSLQMPADKKNWKAYADDFPRAHQEIEAGIAFLRNEKKVEKIYLMGHSMGSRMATSFLASNPSAPIAAFIGVGIRNGGPGPLDSNANLRRVELPVLDVYGDGGDGVDMTHAEARSDMVSDRYKQVLISGANHTFDGQEEEMVKTVIDWLPKRP